MTSPVVRALDDGRVLMVVPREVARDLTSAVIHGGRRIRQAGAEFRSPWTEVFADDLCTRFALDTPMEDQLSASSVDRLLGTGSLAGMAISEACDRLGLRPRQVYKLRIAEVLRPAGRGRVLQVDVAAEVARREASR